jgi:hypothetical protein
MSEKPRPVEVVNLSGKPMNLDEWSKGDKLLALNLASWLADQKATVAISTTDDGAILLDYSWGGQIWPTIRVYSGKMIWPKGTPFDLQMKFLSGER